MGKFLDGWLDTLNSGSLVVSLPVPPISQLTLPQSSVLAAVATALFVHVQEQMKFPNGLSSLSWASDTYSGQALLFFAYLGIVINCGAAITSFLISARLVETPFHSAKSHWGNPDRLPQEGLTDDGPNRFFYRHLGWKPWEFFKYFCELHSWNHSLMRSKLLAGITSLFCGILAIVAEMLLYMWIVEPGVALKVLVTFSALFVLLPLMVFSWGIYDQSRDIMS